jgi:hypothetical protein
MRAFTLLKNYSCIIQCSKGGGQQIVDLAFRISHCSFGIGHMPPASLGQYASLSFVGIGTRENRGIKISIL